MGGRWRVACGRKAGGTAAQQHRVPHVTSALQCEPPKRPSPGTFELWFLVFCVEFIIFYFVCNSICVAVIKVLLLRQHLSPVATVAPSRLHSASTPSVLLSGRLSLCHRHSHLDPIHSPTHPVV